MPPTPSPRLYSPVAIAILGLLLVAARAHDDDVVWLEAETFSAAVGEVQLIDAAAADFGSMARNEASAQRFLRIPPGGEVRLDPFETEHDAEWAVWVRAFFIPSRGLTVSVGGRPAGSTTAYGEQVVLSWQRIGTIVLPAGEHRVTLAAADGNTRLAYADVVALLAQPHATPIGRTPEEILFGEPESALREDFKAASLDEVHRRWMIAPPPGEDATVGLDADADGGAGTLRVHNGAGRSFRLTSRRLLGLGPGDQVTVRLRARKGALLPRLELTIPGVGRFAPQLYRDFRTFEKTWLIPPGAPSPLSLYVTGSGGGATWIAAIEAFRPDPPLDPYQTGLFVQPGSLHRDGRLFEIETCLANPEAVTWDADVDGDGRWAFCRLPADENAPLFSRGTVLKSDTVRADRTASEEGCPPLRVRAGPLEAGLYHAYLGAPGRALAYSTDGVTWRRIGGQEAADLGVVAVTDGAFEFLLDDRYAEPDNPGPAMADFVRFMPVEDPAYTMAPVPPVVVPARGSTARESLRLRVHNPGTRRRREPVRSGVPFPAGILAAAEHARLLDAAGQPVHLAAQVTGRWPDGSVRWLLLDFTADVAAGDTGLYTLEYGHAVVPHPPPPSLGISGTAPRLRVDTGAVAVAFDTAAGDSFRMTLAGAPGDRLTYQGMRIVGADGRTWRSAADAGTDLTIEEEGPLRATVRLRGRLQGDTPENPLRFDTRVHLFAGRRDVLIEAGFIASADQETVPIRAVALAFRGDWRGHGAVLGLDDAPGPALPVESAPRLVQRGAAVHGSEGGFSYDLTWRAVGAAAGGGSSGGAAPGWLRLAGPNGLMAALPHFHQQYPKAIACTGEEVAIELWPDGEGIFTAHAGSGKSHAVGISLEAATPPERWLQPLFAVADPEWYGASGAFGMLTPRRDERYAGYEDIVEAAFEEVLRVRAGYGMENWGDVWQPGYVPGAKTWSNQEWDLVNHWVVSFARTGDLRFLDFAHAASRHYADVDCIQDSRDPAQIGGAWMHAHTSLIGHQLEPPNFAHAGWVEGMLHVHHLTGDRRGLEAATALADWIARHAPPTDRHPPQGPRYNLHIQRSAGWPLTTLCLVFRETGNPVLLQTARRIVDYARRVQDPERGIWDAQVGHEIPYRGGCVFAFTLLRGLRLFADLTGEEHANESIRRAARWVFGEMWRPGHRYLYEQCPLHEPGTRVPFLLGDMAGDASRLTGDPFPAIIAMEDFLESTRGGRAGGLQSSAARVQWGNGILQQAPRLLHAWESLGFDLDPRVALLAAAPTVRLGKSRAGEVVFMLQNGLAAEISDITVRAVLRGDWRVLDVAAPAVLPAGRQGAVTIGCAAPAEIAVHPLENDKAYLHAVVSYRRAGRPGAAWGFARVEMPAGPDVQAPSAVALRPGGQSALRVAVSSEWSGDASTVVASTDLAGVAIGTPVVTGAPTGDGMPVHRISLPLTANADAPEGTGSVTLKLGRGRQAVTFAVPAEVGRLRVALIESSAADEWRHPFEVLRAYPGIAPVYLPPESLPQALAETAEGIAAQWEVLVIGDTGTGAAAFTPAQLAAIAAFVRGGGGLITVGGARCYTPGGYAGTPLAEVLPVLLDDGAYVPGMARVVVQAPQVRLFEKYTPDFPPFAARQRLSAKPGMRVLASFDGGAPFIVCGHAGEGRVMALGAIWNHASGQAFRLWPRYGTFVGRAVRWAGGDLPLE